VVSRAARLRVRPWPSGRRALVVLVALFGAFGLASASSALDLLIDDNGAGTGLELFTPYSIAWDPIGDRVIVPSYENSLVFAISGIGGGTLSIEVLMDATGDGTHALDGPWGVAVGPDGSVYVSGDNSNNIFRITQAGVKSQIVDQTGTGVGQPLLSPRGVAIAQNGNVYVAGHASHNVLEIEPGGAVFEIIETLGDGMGNSLLAPLDVVVDLIGNVYVTGHFSDNVFRIDDQGVIEEIVDSTGDGQGNGLSRPWGIDITSQGEVVVAGNASNNVLQRQANGNVLEILDVAGDGGTQLVGPVGVATGFGGVVYVTSSVTDSVFQVRPLEPPALAADGSGDGMGNLLVGPWGLDVDGDGNLLVAGVFSYNAFGGTPPPFQPVPGLLAPGVGAALALLLGAGVRRLRLARPA